ncbi:MAG: DUF72 domain-containing protein [Clostridiaceae bacterium]|nr:DUF72 domain-containing protein [Clostridiaceae bacterium]
MIYIGTAGYSYKDWIGPFYPDDIKQSAMLEYYSARFDFVEINSTYYHMPAVRIFESLNRKTPAKFMFSVKIYGGFTHERTHGFTGARQFMQAVQPLIESKKLICLLAQFPYSFHYTRENLEYIKNLRHWFDNVEICIEFRNRNWINEETMQFLKSEGIGFVCVDEPNIRGLVGNVIAVTSNISYIRMHGRNAEKWYGSQGSERYDYLYSIDELIEWVTKIKELEDKSALTVVSFNNHPLGKAVKNARALRALLYGTESD